jgi:NAD-dependent deacetylase
MKKLVVLSGAGISAESGIPTFRASDGLWENHRIEDVATPEGWTKNQELVLEFYNQRRKKALESKPNKGHSILAELQENFDVTIVTQNVDDLHERAGSKKVIHLHGSLFEARSTADESLVYPIKGAILDLGEVCSKGSQLRPNIVWFGEAVPAMDVAINEASNADIFIVVGTSMLVYPAASLINYVPRSAQKFLVDPKLPVLDTIPNLRVFQEKGSTGLAKVKKILLAENIN